MSTPTPGSIKCEPKRLIIDGRVEMKEPLRPVVEAMAAEAAGHVLEIGFGMGVGHAALHANPLVRSIVTVDLRPEVFDHYKTCDCRAVVGDWRSIPRERYVETVVFDAERPAPVEELAKLLSNGGQVVYYIEPASHGLHKVRYESTAG